MTKKQMIEEYAKLRYEYLKSFKPVYNTIKERAKHDERYVTIQYRFWEQFGAVYNTPKMRDKKADIQAKLEKLNEYLYRINKAKELLKLN